MISSQNLQTLSENLITFNEDYDGMDSLDLLNWIKLVLNHIIQKN